jgi:hypothetical protein
LARIIRGPGISGAPCATQARSASEGKSLSLPRLRFGLVFGRGEFGPPIARFPAGGAATPGSLRQVGSLAREGSRQRRSSPEQPDLAARRVLTGSRRSSPLAYRRVTNRSRRSPSLPCLPSCRCQSRATGTAVRMIRASLALDVHSTTGVLAQPVTAAKSNLTRSLSPRCRPSPDRDRQRTPTTAASAGCTETFGVWPSARRAGVLARSYYAMLHRRRFTSSVPQQNSWVKSGR